MHDPVVIERAHLNFLLQSLTRCIRQLELDAHSLPSCAPDSELHRLQSERRRLITSHKEIITTARSLTIAVEPSTGSESVFLRPLK